MKILGLSAFYHDSAAAILCDSTVVAAAQEERFTRKKHDSRFPANAIRFCLQEAGLRLDEIDFVSFYDKPFLKFERLLETYLDFAPRGFLSFRTAMPVWTTEKLFQKKILGNLLKKCQPGLTSVPELLFSEHHLSHAASAFYPSPFDRAVILTADGVGEWATTSVAIGDGASIEMQKEIHFPHSLGLLYSALTYYLGFKVNSGEYKVMGLAPYGKPEYVDVFYDHLIDVKNDGSFRLNMDYFDYCTGLVMVNDKFAKLFGQPVRKSETPLTQRHMNIAASLQVVLEDILLKMTKSLYAQYQIPNLCLAGGVALNCVANGKILKQSGFKNIWVQPAAGDAGGALGAALAAHHIHAGMPRKIVAGDAMNGSYLGPAYTSEQIKSDLDKYGASYVVLDENEILERGANALSDEKVIGWFQGRMEFGPRALGNRSIIADARSPKMQSMLNLKIKYRESFRPFAPSVLREHVSDWFDLDTDSPYMLLVADVLPEKRKAVDQTANELFGIDKLKQIRSEIPAVTHVDYSARIQTVHEKTNPVYYALIKKFQERTGCPVIINTSFNIRGEPIVCTPADAYRCFMGTEMDILVLGNFWLEKNSQNKANIADYKEDFELD